MEEKNLSECEELVIRVIWSSAEPLTMQEITEKVNKRFGRSWSAKTVSVFLHRIVHKGYLTAERRGRIFYYHPIVKEEIYRDHVIKKCVDVWSDGRVDAFLAAFMQTRGLSEEEKTRIRGMIDAME